MPFLPVAAAAVRVVISSWVRTLTAELMAEMRWHRSAPIASAASTHCPATSVAADATATSVFAILSSFPVAEAAAVAAAMAATAAATLATDTTAWSWALWALASCFFFSFLSFNHLLAVLPLGVLTPLVPPPWLLWPPMNRGCSVLFDRRYCIRTNISVVNG